MTRLATRLVPLGDRLILRRIDEGHGPIKMPDVDQQEQQSQECEVMEVPLGGIEIGTTMAVAFDKEKTTQNMKKVSLTRVIAVGDRVYIARHKGYNVTTNDGDELVVVDAVDVLCVEVDEVKPEEEEEVPF